MTIYLVTGGAGFIGSNIVKALLKQKNTYVRILDNFSTGQYTNIPDFNRENVSRLKIINGNICDLCTATETMQDVDFVLHQAAIPSVAQSVKNPILTNEVNVTGTLNLLQAARLAGVKRFVFASSSAVYGNTVGSIKISSMCPNPASPYAVSKLAGESYCQSFWKLYGLETVVLRYFNVFGPGQNLNSEYSAVIPKFIKATLAGEPLTIYGDGKQTRDFVFVEDVVRVNLRACDLTNWQVIGQTFNIGNGVQKSVLDLVDALQDLTGGVQIEHLPERTGDVKHSFADIGYAQSELGYNPRIDFETGLKKMIEWIKDNDRV